MKNVLFEHHGPSKGILRPVEATRVLRLNAEGRISLIKIRAPKVLASLPESFHAVRAMLVMLQEGA